jgi:phosphohistidine phosphatase SixA
MMSRGTRPTRRMIGCTLDTMALGLALLVTPGVAFAADEALWELLRGGGQIILMRHATTTPGVGDPPGFRPDDCATQRNLSEAGRQESRRIGAVFQDRGIPVGRVLSSRWCRCMETARLAFGRAEHWAALDSNFEDRSREGERTAAIRTRASQRVENGNLILVTHGANIVPVTGSPPAPGEFFILTPEGDGRFRVAGRLAPSSLQ